MRASYRPVNTSRWLLLGALAGILCAPSPARATRETDLASSFDTNGVFNVDLRIGYSRILKQGEIKRELAGLSSYDLALVKELRFSQVKDVLSLRNDYTLWKALQIYVELPIVLQDTRNLDFAQNDGGSCIGNTGVPEDNCVTRNNSTLARDRLINRDQMADNQVAVAGPDPVLGGYQLPRRSGIDQLYIGLAGAPLSQERDDTKPTWVIGFEARIAIGDSMEYNPYYNPAQPEGPLNPKGNSAVGQGIHQFKWWTSVSRRFKHLDPWMSFYYLLPNVKDNSLMDRTTFELSGQERSSPMQRGGMEVGLGIVPWERRAKQQRVSIDLSANLEGVFEGRGYSEMWEVFANNPMLSGPCRPVPNSNFPGQWNNGTYCSNPQGEIPFPGITNIENHYIITGKLRVDAELTRFFRGHAGVAFGHESDHTITFGDAGHSPSPTRSIDLQDERQVNPMYRPLVDSPGRRFRVSNTTVFEFFVGATGQF